jgi:hypothetical protein
MNHPKKDLIPFPVSELKNLDRLDSVTSGLAFGSDKFLKEGRACPTVEAVETLGLKRIEEINKEIHIISQSLRVTLFGKYGILRSFSFHDVKNKCRVELEKFSDNMNEENIKSSREYLKTSAEFKHPENRPAFEMHDYDLVQPANYTLKVKTLYCTPEEARYEDLKNTKSNKYREKLSVDIPNL